MLFRSYYYCYLDAADEVNTGSFDQVFGTPVSEPLVVEVTDRQPSIPDKMPRDSAISSDGTDADSICLSPNHSAGGVTQGQLYFTAHTLSVR